MTPVYTGTSEHSQVLVVCTGHGDRQSHRQVHVRETGEERSQNSTPQEDQLTLSDDIDIIREASARAQLRRGWDP